MDASLSGRSAGFQGIFDCVDGYLLLVLRFQVPHKYQQSLPTMLTFGKYVDLAVAGEAWVMLCENEPKYSSLIAKHV